MATLPLHATIVLPSPKGRLALSVEDAIRRRRSVREFANDALTLEEMSRILWSAQGVTDAAGHRAAPSAGEVYPLVIDVAASHVSGLEAGLYRYEPGGHTLRARVEGDLLAELTALSHDQGCVAEAAAIVVVSAVEARMAAKYGASSAPLYVAMEVGCALQNAALEAVALGLGSVIVGAFRPEALRRALELGPGEETLALLAVGKPW